MKKSLKVLIASSAIMLGVSLLAGCEEKIPVSQIHEHTFSENWEASDSTHWHKATCEHTDVMSNVEDHKFGAWNTDKEPTQEAEGSKSRICTVCQYKQVAAIAKLDHTHVFSTEWSKDAEYHWHDATCHTDVRADVAKHTFGNWTVKVEPTETTKGLKERECSVCGYVEKAEVDQTLHVHTYASEWSTNETSHWKAATCEHADSFLKQLLGETWWDEIDYLVVDMPPGTGDIQLTLAQTMPVTGAISVSTPQQVALADVVRGVELFRNPALDIPVLGFVENMS